MKIKGMVQVKMPWWIKMWFPKQLVWKMPPVEKPTIYLTFDDGPHPTITSYILGELAEYNAKATFFCIGKNVAAWPDIYQRIIDEGHSVGNHTNNHLNGWQTKTEDYLKNIMLAAKLIDSPLFRPPYGRITYSQIKFLLQAKTPFKIIMWDVLSKDYNKDISPEVCLKNVLSNITPGSIVVFHDSEKAWDRMRYALPRVLKYCREKGWELKAISMAS